MDDFRLQDECQKILDVDNYDIQNEHDIPSMDHREIVKLLEGAIEAVENSPDAITSPETFDIYRSLLKHSNALQGSVMNKLLDSVSSGFQKQVEIAQRDIDQNEQHTFTSHRQTLEVYAFLLRWFVTAVDRVKSKDDEDAVAAGPTKAKRGRGGRAGGRAVPRAEQQWSWAGQIPQTLTLICKVLKLKTHRLWTTTPDRDAFINCLTQPAYRISESEAYMKHGDIRLPVYKVICLAVKHHGHGFNAQSSIMQALQFWEHLSEPMADALIVLINEFDHSQLAEDILREVAAKNFSAQDTKSPRAFSRFLVRMGEYAPRVVLKQISLLMSQLDSESYPIRMAIVEIIGFLIKEISSSDDGDRNARDKQIKGLFSILIERFLDVSSYVRAKVINTLSKLCDLPYKFPRQRLTITSRAVAALEDKASSVRRYAIMLLTKLILTHPYGLMHGGLLNIDEWQDRYDLVCKELAVAEGEGIEGGGAAQGDEDAEKDEGGDDETQDGETRDADSEIADDAAEDASQSTPKRKKKVRAKKEEDTEDDMDVDDSTATAAGNESVDGDEDAEDVQKKRKKKARKSQIDVLAPTDEQVAMARLENNNVVALTLRRRYYAEALSFIRRIEGGVGTISKLLGSTSKAEVLESMEFFRVTYEYQFKDAEQGVKQMLHLIWSKDNTSTSEDGKELKGVRSRLLECYRSLYFDPLPDLDAKQQINRIAKNMIELTYNSTLAVLTSLEEMMRAMMEDDQIHPDVITKLWQVYSSHRPLPPYQRCGAIIILGMLALAKKDVVTERVDTLLKIGLGQYGKDDLRLARYTCVALQRLSGSAKKIKGALLDSNVRLRSEAAVFHHLREIIEAKSRSREWFAMAEQAINTIYALAEHPDVLCSEIIKSLARRVFGQEMKAMPEQPKDDDAMQEDQLDDTRTDGFDEAEKSFTQQNLDSTDKGDTFELSKLIFVVGHVAMKQIVFLELVETELKRQKDEREKEEKKQASKARGKGNKTVEELEEVAGNAEDEIGERIAGVREKELLFGHNSLLATFGPMIVDVCRYPGRYKNAILRSTAILSFSKLLCVSSEFCEQYHGLLFTLYGKTKDHNIRSNIVIALGDVAVCFSNIIDENSNELYKGLSDTELIVKKNTLMVLTHLILNGMIKVKGQLGEMAKCLEDEETRIADLAKLFFKELSTKDNAIYNNLPDVISHLSIGQHAVDEAKFQSTMKYIFTFIEKEKQAENIVEKLCQRFRLAEEPRQWRDIAFCLSLLPFKSERSVKKLTEGLMHYQDKLHDKDVYERFQEILSKARSNKSQNKPDADLNEFEAILEQHKLQGEEDQALEKRAQGKKAAARKRAARNARKKAVRIEHDSDDE